MKSLHLSFSLLWQNLYWHSYYFCLLNKTDQYDISSLHLNKQNQTTKKPWEIFLGVCASFVSSVLSRSARFWIDLIASNPVLVIYSCKIFNMFATPFGIRFNKRYIRLKSTTKTKQNEKKEQTQQRLVERKNTKVQNKLLVGSFHSCSTCDCEIQEVPSWRFSFKTNSHSAWIISLCRSMSTLSISFRTFSNELESKYFLALCSSSTIRSSAYRTI